MVYGKQNRKLKLIPDQEKIRKEINKLVPLEKFIPLSTNSWNFIYSADYLDQLICIKLLPKKEFGYVRSYNEFLLNSDFQRFLVKVNCNFVLHMKLINSKYINEISDFFVICYDWIDEFDSNICKWPLTDEVCYSAAEALASFHNLSSQFETNSNTNQSIPQRFNPYYWKKNLNRIFETSQENLEGNNASSHCIDKFKNVWSISSQFIDENQEFFTNDDSLLIHGDYRPDNLALINGNPLIFDLDNCHLSSIESELAYAALSFSGPKWFYGSRNWKQVFQFVEMYKDQSILVIDEKKLRSAFLWNILKSISLSFKEEQIDPRVDLFNEAKLNLSGNI